VIRFKEVPVEIFIEVPQIVEKIIVVEKFIEIIPEITKNQDE
jgi:hypothetical protein